VTAREEILSKIIDRDCSLPGGVWESPFEPEDLWAQFEERLVGLGGSMIDLERLTMLASGSVFAEAGTGFESNVESIWDAEVGISVGEFAIAETGSVVVSSAPRRHRMSTLLPPVSVVMLDSGQIVATLADAFDRIPTRNSVIISGTSRTADIEGVLVRGVHGPGEFYVYRGPQ